MGIELTPELETSLRDHVSSGAYPSVAAVIAAGLRMVDDCDRRTDALRRIASKLLELQSHKSDFSSMEEFSALMDAADASRSAGKLIPESDVRDRMASLARDWRDAEL